MARTAHESDIEAWLDSLDLSPGAFRDAVHIRRIIAARTAADTAEAELRAAVEAARTAGDSWTLIGLALGTSKQNAHRKYARKGV